MRRLSRAQLRAEVVAHASAYDAAANDNPFASAAWTVHFLDQVARDDWTFWLAGSVADGATLLYSDPARPHDVLALTNYYASLYTAALGAGRNHSAVEALPRGLAQIRPRLASVNLAPLESAQADALEGAFRGARWMTRRYHCFGNWFLPCDGLAFDAYMAARPSQLVNTWTRKAKKFAPGGPARLQLVTRPDEVAQAMQAYRAIYEKSWKIPEPYPDFVGAWAAISAQRGWLRLGLAWVDDTPIAAQFWFVRNRRAYIYKLAYDEAHAKWSAGTVLSAFLFRHCLEVDRVIEIDYLTGDDAYKRSWMDLRRERVGLLACNPRHLQGLMRGCVELAGACRQRWRASVSGKPAGAAVA